MYCENCGRSNADGARFCQYCGAAMEDAPPAAAVVYCENCGHGNMSDKPYCEQCGCILGEARQSLTDEAAPTPAPKKQKSKKWLLFTAAALLMIIVAAAAVFLLAPGNRVYLQNYMQIEVQGYNGYGTVECRLDTLSLAARAMGNKDAYGCTEDAQERWKKELAALPQNPQVQALIAGVNYTCTYPAERDGSDLRNGDVVTVSINCDKILTEACGLTVKDVTYTYKVEGLTEVQTYEPLKYFDLEITGYHGWGQWALVCSTPDSVQMGDLTFAADADSGCIVVYDENGVYDRICLEVDGAQQLRNGDVLKLRAGKAYDSYAEHGVILGGLEKQVTVSGLPECAQVDLFGFYKFSVTGISGQGSGSWKCTSDSKTVDVGGLTFNLDSHTVWEGERQVGAFHFYFDEEGTLKNGDTAVVRLSINADELVRFGVRAASDVMEFTVSGLGEYVSASGDVRNAANIGAISSWGAECISKELMKSWKYLVHDTFSGLKDYKDLHIGNDMTLQRIVVSVPQVPGQEDQVIGNRVYFIYSATLDDDQMAPALHYMLICLEDVILYPDGTIGADKYNAYYQVYTSYRPLYTRYIENYGWQIRD